MAGAAESSNESSTLSTLREDVVGRGLVFIGVSGHRAEGYRAAGGRKNAGNRDPESGSAGEIVGFLALRTRTVVGRGEAVRVLSVNNFGRSAAVSATPKRGPLALRSTRASGKRRALSR